MKTLAEVGELGLIARLKAMAPPSDIVWQGIGDDAAVSTLESGRVLLSTVDTMVAGEHFLPDRMPLHLVGRKAMASSVSDIVAMNGTPHAALVSLSAPGDLPLRDAEHLYQGLLERAQEYGVALVGGDTTRSPVLTLAITVIGDASPQKIVLRSGAETGDLLCVTGTLGASHAGLQCILQGISDDRASVQDALRAHCDPSARLDIVRDWATRGFVPHALTDISDGLAAELHHLCEASACGATIEADRLPVSDTARSIAHLNGDDALDYALYWGEDYELVFTASESALGVLDVSTYTIIGRITAASEGMILKTRECSSRPLPRRGWQHFAEQAPPM